MRSERPRDAAVHRRATTGFTLLEVLLAFAMLTIVTGTTVGVASTALRGSAERAERAWLVELARSAMEEHLATRRHVSAAERLGQIAQWHWRIDERPAEPDPAFPALSRDGYVRVEVTVWNGAAPDRVVTLEGLVAGGAAR